MWTTIKPSIYNICKNYCVHNYSLILHNLSISSDTPFGMVPILEVHGKRLTSSIGIARMIAEENGEFDLNCKLHATSIMSVG